jgi:hypothetical protein
MQPLNTADRPRSESTIGCAPRSDKSMIFRRRCPSAIDPAACRPEPSGPRGAIAAVIRATASTSGPSDPWPVNRISPAMPHMRVLPIVVP